MINGRDEAGRLLRAGMIPSVTVGLMALSWVPAKYKVVSGVMWTQADHAVAYAAAAIAISLALGRSLSVRYVVLLLLLVATGLEVGQAYFPGRTPALIDWLGSVTGAVLGALAIAVARAVRPDVPSRRCQLET